MSKGWRWEMMVGELKLELLGSLSITLNGAALRGLRYAKAEALLCYLALSGRSHSREALAALLWSDLPDKDARTNLRGVLSKLHKALPQHLVIAHNSVTFSRESPYLLDAEAFLAKLEGGDTRALREAVALYRGELLEGFGVQGAPLFEDWLAGQRERFKLLAVQALHGLAAHHTERGDYTAATDYLSRLLALEPWREESHRQLMTMLAVSGQQGAALAQYETCRRTLLEELGLEPSAQTTELYERIKAGDVSASRPPPHNLPLLPTALVGREGDLARVAELLAGCRLLTLLGPGGVGKTSLALQAARGALASFPGGVFFVPLAALDDPELVTEAVAQALGVQEAAEQPLLERLAQRLQGSLQGSLQGRLQGGGTLLLLDNFEHLLGAAPVVAELLARCPKLKVMTTSRATLGLRGEQEYGVPPLTVPDLRQPLHPDALLRYPAVTLFCARAKAVKPSFELNGDNAVAVATICVRLDGLPLALELAAVRVKTMSPGVLLARLGKRLKLLTGGARDLPPRQRTLHNAVAWSYELLAPEMRVLFARLAVFAGSFALDAAEAVCAAPSPFELDILGGVTSLADKSLVQREERGGEVRFGLLETLREYALERLAKSGETEALRARHAAYFRDVSERAELGMKGAEQVGWMMRLEMEADNLRAALTWALEAGEQETGLRLAGALPWFWFTRGFFSEGRAWLEGALLEGRGAPPRLRAKARCGAGMLARRQGDYGAAAAHLGAGLELFEQLGDKGGVAACLHHLAHVAEARGDYPGTTARFRESLSLAREAGDTWELSLSLNCLGHVAHEHGDDRWAAALLGESLPLCRKLGNRYGLGEALRVLGVIALNSGDDRQAAQHLEGSLALARELGNKQGMALLYPALARVALHTGDLTRAKELLRRGLALRNEGGEVALLQGLQGLAEVAYHENDFEGAARFLGATEAVRETSGSEMPGAETTGESVNPCYLDKRLVAEARAALGDERFAAAWAEGRALDLGEAWAKGREMDFGEAVLSSLAAVTSYEPALPSKAPAGRQTSRSGISRD